MIVYCDTSALVKLYIIEEHREAVQALVAEAEAVACARIAWVELHAALARRSREVPEDADEIEKARRAFAEDWPDMLVLELTDPVARLAGEYADTFALRGYDAVHLASAASLRGESGEPITFACFDRRLNKAASVLGMQVIDF